MNPCATSVMALRLTAKAPLLMLAELFGEYNAASLPLRKIKQIRPRFPGHYAVHRRWPRRIPEISSGPP